MYKNLLGAAALVSVVIAGFIFKSSYSEARNEVAADYAPTRLSIRSDTAFNPTDSTSAPLRVVNVAPKDANVDQMMAIILNELRNETNTDVASALPTPTAAAASSNGTQTDLQGQSNPNTNQASTDNARSTPLGSEELLQALVNRSLVSANVSDISRTALSRTSLESTKRHKVKRGESLATIAIKYYGTKDGYKAIFAANKTKLKSPDQIRVGQVLIIPDY